MNNKFIRVLIIINGMLIPIFIIFLFGSFIFDKIEKNKFGSSTIEVLKKDENKFELEYSSPKKILNSEYYYVATSKVYPNEIDLGEDFLKLIPSNTINLLFLDKEFNISKKLLNKNGSILNMILPNDNSDKISYYIALKDSNKDGLVNKFDQHYVYISEFNGNNLVKVSNRKVKQYQWVNNYKDLLLTFVNEDKSIEYGVYNIESKKITKKNNLNKDK